MEGGPVLTTADRATCSVGDDECVDGRLKRGMCEKHYRRYKSTGAVTYERVPTLDRYVVETTDYGECFRYTGPLYSNGYGKLSRAEHGTRLAHRANYIDRYGAVSAELDLDHLCRNRWCMNPEHLEPVTRRVNLNRGYLSTGVCRNGLHPKTTTGACVECLRAKQRRANARR